VPRYLIKRTFPGGLAVPANEAGASVFAGVVATNAELGVTWIHSYISEDRQTMTCLYEGPDADAIREAARRNGLPVDLITRVSCLDPHFYR
jgi:hypothetical protein